jgi:xylan 1,4-beta-xylosidase
MSYWVFTDIFEEPGPRFTPFHGGFGLLNTQGIKKSAYFSYSFLNKLGETELQNTDTSSWVTRNANGDVQVLFWDYTYTLPEATNNQQYYIKDLPSKPKGNVKIEVTGLQQGKYRLEIRKVGYKANDVFTDYLGMNKPNQLTKEQVNTLKEKNNGEVYKTENVSIDAKGTFSKLISINENDVYLYNFIKQ